MVGLTFDTDTETDTEDDILFIRKPLTYMSLCFYSLLFAYIYVQLWLVIRHGYKRWCYRTYVLYTSIVWCLLRVTLFAYYCQLEHRVLEARLSGLSHTPELSRLVGSFSYFVLYSFPLYLQFSCLCLMVAYFHQIHRSSRNNFHPSELGEWRWPQHAIVCINILVLVVNLASSFVIKWQDSLPILPTPLHPATTVSPLLQESEHNLLQEGEHGILQGPSIPIVTVYMVHVRVLVNGASFVAMASALAYVSLGVAKTNEARLLLETENLTQRSAVLVGILLVFLYLCRTVVNILALVPAVSFVLDTDQVDLLSDSKSAYFMFLVVLFMWEFLPTLLMVVFFRVKRPPARPHLPPTAEAGSGGAGGSSFVVHTASQLLTDSISDGSSDDDLHRYSLQHGGNLPYLPQPPHILAPHFPYNLHAPPQYHPSPLPTPRIGYNPNSQYSYEIASSEPREAIAASPSYPCYDSGTELLEGEESGGDGVHSRTRRFLHRTSLFSQKILNRANLARPAV